MTPKKWKNGPQKLLIIGPDPFISQSSPDQLPTAQNWFFILWNLRTRHLFSYLCICYTISTALKNDLLFVCISVFYLAVYLLIWYFLVRISELCSHKGVILCVNCYACCLSCITSILSHNTTSQYRKHCNSPTFKVLLKKSYCGHILSKQNLRLGLVWAIQTV